ncbi:hypothetical protein FD755_015127, partial [Muntiacus reevesi]
DLACVHGWLRRGPPLVNHRLPLLTPSLFPPRPRRARPSRSHQNPSQVLNRADSRTLSLHSKVPKLPSLVPPRVSSGVMSLAPSRANSLFPSHEPSHAGSRVQTGPNLSRPGSRLPSLTPSGPGSGVASFTPSQRDSKLFSRSTLHTASQATILSGKLVPRSGSFALPENENTNHDGEHEAASGRA